MNQKEEIEKHEKKIEELKLKLDKAEHIFKTKYGYVTEKIEELSAKRNKLYAELDKITTQVAEVLSDYPQMFKQGHSQELKKEILSRIDMLGDDQWRYSERDVRSVVWDKYNHFLKESPVFKKIEERIDAIWRQEVDLKGISKGYSDMSKEIEDIKRDIAWEQQFIERLKNIGWFRQFSKEQKERDIRDARRAEVEKEVAKFSAWFDKMYLPKMKKAIAKKGDE